MRIFLLRHGATDWNLAGKCQGLTDIELNAAGRVQAEAAAEALAGEAIAAIYSSHLKRALATAAAVARPHGLEAVIEENLHELDHGELEGLTFAEIQSVHTDFIRDWRERPAEALVPGGEQLAAVERRAWAALHRIVSRHRDDETLVVVSHNFPILSVVCRILGTPLNRYRAYHVAPGGLVRLEYAADGGWRVDGAPPLRRD
jgi:broad specificity phosphatase PhoE